MQYRIAFTTQTQQLVTVDNDAAFRLMCCQHLADAVLILLRKHYVGNSGIASRVDLVVDVRRSESRR